MVIGAVHRYDSHKLLRPGQVFIDRHLGNSYMRATDTFTAELYILKEHIKVGYMPVLSVYTSLIPCKIIAINHLMKRSSTYEVESELDGVK